MKKKENISLELNKITNPNFVKKLSYGDCYDLAEDIREYIISSVSKYGGHLSSNLGNVESIISLCRVFDFDKDKIIFDVGHQCYTYKILTGRSLDNLRSKDGVCGFQCLSESKYDHYEAGHSSTSISAANGMAIARDLKGEKFNIIAYVGDSSMANGLSFEGLNNLAQDNHKVIIVLNDNNMSISAPVGGISRFFKNVSVGPLYIRFKNKFKSLTRKNKFGLFFFNLAFRLKTFVKRIIVPSTLFDNMGFKYFKPINGHNLKDLDRAFKKAKKCKKSCIVHIRTRKGAGYEPAEKDINGYFHGVGPFDIKTGKPIKDSELPSWSKVYADLLDKEFEVNKNLILITPATEIGSSLENVFSKYKNRAIDVGIAEEHAITMASGIAIGGFHPVISIYSSFLQRAYDEILHDLARMNLNATLLIDRAGLVGKDGATHQGIFDEAFLYDIPNTVIAMASDISTIKSLFDESLNKHGVFAIRYPRSDVKPSLEETKIGFGKWLIRKEGKEKAIIGVGPNLLKVNELLKDTPYKVIDAIYQKPFDKDMINTLLDFKEIIIYDSYGVESGFAKEVSNYLYSLSFKGKVTIKAVKNEFINHMSIEEQEEMLSIRPIDIYNYVIK